MQREPLSRSRGTAIPKRGRPQPCSVSLSPIPGLPRGPLPRCPINRLHHRFHGHHLLSLNLSSAATAWSSAVVVRCHAAIAAIVAFQPLPCFCCVLHRGRLPPYSTGLSHVPGLTSGASSWQPYCSTAWASHLYPLGAPSWPTAAIQQQRRERERERERGMVAVEGEPVLSAPRQSSPHLMAAPVVSSWAFRDVQRRTRNEAAVLFAPRGRSRR